MRVFVQESGSPIGQLQLIWCVFTFSGPVTCLFNLLHIPLRLLFLASSPHFSAMNTTNVPSRLLIIKNTSVAFHTSIFHRAVTLMHIN